MPEDCHKWIDIDAELADDDKARIVERQVDQLSRSTVDRLYKGAGKLAYDPILMLKMALYQILLGRHSPAQWYLEASRNLGMRWLGHGYVPSRRTWYDFRDRAGKFIEVLHKELVLVAVEQGHTKTDTAALDGSSVAACASRHRMVNEKTLKKRRRIIGDAIAGQTPEQSINEPAWPQWMPKSETGRNDLVLRMDRAAKVLAERLHKNESRPSGKRKAPDKVVVSLSDPDAPLGLDKRKTYRPLYTVQKMVDPVSHLTLSYMVEARTNDAGMLKPMILLTQSIVGGVLKWVLADGGYCTIRDLIDSQTHKIVLIAPVSEGGTGRQSKTPSGEAQIPRSQFAYDSKANHYTCPQAEILVYKGRQKQHRDNGGELYQSRYQCTTATCLACELASQCLSGKGGRIIKRTDGEELLEAQRAMMETAEAKAQYKRRGQTIELVFADLKGNRRHDRFHGRGLARARAEMGMLTVAENLLRLDNLQQKSKKTAKHAT